MCDTSVALRKRQRARTGQFHCPLRKPLERRAFTEEEIEAKEERIPHDPQVILDSRVLANSTNPGDPLRPSPAQNARPGPVGVEERSLLTAT